MRIVCSLLYLQHSSRKKFLQWLNTGHSSRLSTEGFLVTLHAFLDAVFCHDDDLGDLDTSALDVIFARLLNNICKEAGDVDLVSQCGDCLVMVIAMAGVKKQRCISALLTHVQSLPPDRLTIDLLSVCHRMHKSSSDLSYTITHALVDVGLHYAVQCFAGSQKITESVSNLLNSFGMLVSYLFGLYRT